MRGWNDDCKYLDSLIQRTRRATGARVDIKILDPDNPDEFNRYQVKTVSLGGETELNFVSDVLPSLWTFFEGVLLGIKLANSLARPKQERQ
jgi:hypothetical protein